MTKKTKTTEPTTEQTVMPVAESVEPVKAGDASMGIVPVESTEVVPTPVKLKVWTDDLPRVHREIFAHTQAVEPDELEAAVAALPEPKRANFQDMLDKMNPIKPGVFIRERKFSTWVARIYQGMGNDPGRPQTAPKGSIYTTDGRILCVESTAHSKQLKIPTEFIATVVGVQETRAWIRPKRKDFQAPAGVGPKEDVLCRSADRQRGTRFGLCAACSHRPYAGGKYDEDGCTNEARLFLVLQDFSGLYQLTLKGKSIQNALKNIVRLGNGLKRHHDRWFAFSLKEERNEKGSWHSLCAELYNSDAGKAENETTAEERIVLDCISRQIICEMYKPELERIYTQKDTDQPENAANMQALMDGVPHAPAPAATPALPDYTISNL